MSHLERLRTTKSLADLAMLLSYTPKGLAFVLYKKPPEARYRAFSIPKAGGGSRIIQAPEPQLKLVQSRLAELLSECVQSIELEKPDRQRVSHGFHKGRSIVTNAKAHRKRRYVLNLDLRDFFGTINFGRVRGFFIKDQNFKLDPKVATVIAQIACHDNALPQGAPCSPVISNLIGHILDARLIRLARRHECTYTRYADDLTFSTNRRTFPRQLAYSRTRHPNRWTIGRQLRDAIESTGFTINPSKTRMQIRGSRQETTGLIVNEKVNIRQEYYRSLRSMCHALFTTGQYFIEVKIDESGSEIPNYIRNLALLEGRLAHLYYVKARQDLYPREKFKAPEAPKKLYSHFLFYKHFVAPDLPVLITEGKTDIVYLRAAIKALSADYSKLVVESGRNEELAVRFLNATPMTQHILNLGAGFSGMKSIIQRYSSQLKKYRSPPLAHPIILVVDHDTGGEEVLKIANKVSEQEIKPELNDAFFHVQHNLYVVKTPPTSDGGLSDIEDCVPADVLNRKLGAKSFDRKKPHGDESSFGKQIFADQIVRPNAHTIDFSGFSPILGGIVQAINDYENRRKTEQTVIAKSA